MRESRFLKIQNRIVSLADARRLAKPLWDEFSSNTDKNRHIEMTFSVQCEDNSSFSSGDIEIFADDSVINLKRVSSIRMLYWDYQSGARIEIDLTHGDHSYGNSISVDGKDSKWVNGTLRIFEEIIQSFTPQNTFTKKYMYVIVSIIALGLGSIYVWFVIFTSSTKSTEPPPSWLVSFPFLAYIIKYVLALLVGYIPAIFVVYKLQSLWPSVEFQIGPEHTFIEKQRRLWIINVFILGVLPLLSSLIYDVIKALTKNGG